MKAQMNIYNKAQEQAALSAFGSQSCDQLLNLAIDMAQLVMQPKVSTVDESFEVYEEEKVY